MQQVRILRRGGVSALTSLSRPTIYRLISCGKFPKPIRLSANAVGWDVRDVLAWIDDRKASSCGGGAR